MRSNTLGKRIKIAFNFVIYGKGKCRIMTCAKCGSIKIVPISNELAKTGYEKGNFDIDSIWMEYVQCMKCGAVCEEIQMWNFGEKPEKIIGEKEPT